MKVCACGCGESVRSTFVPSHDTILAGRLWAQVRAGGELAERATLELGQRGYLEGGPANWGPGRRLLINGPDAFLAEQVRLRTQGQGVQETLLEIKVQK